ncbi:hypothetical protein GCM10020367_24550 [Streptomyces sannanensis]|uniref:Uncharacterized protein n=1 Tax=Streptomyces sannanensis TaxID=285536 RepID=A0ABP6SAM2_9ACTN
MVLPPLESAASIVLLREQQIQMADTVIGINGHTDTKMTSYASRWNRTSPACLMTLTLFSGRAIR